jgi:hypothetical protein
MRHTFVSKCIAAGIATFEIARMAGRSVLQIEKTYGHPLPDAIERGRAALEAFDARDLADATAERERNEAGCPASACSRPVRPPLLFVLLPRAVSVGARRCLPLPLASAADSRSGRLGGYWAAASLWSGASNPSALAGFAGNSSQSGRRDLNSGPLVPQTDSAVWRRVSPSGWKWLISRHFAFFGRD